MENIVCSDSRLKKRFFLLLCARSASKFAKSSNMIKKIIFSNYFDMGVKKRRIWRVVKNFPHKKLLSWKCTFSPFSTVYKSSQPYNFLCVNFFATFSTDSSSASNPAFSDIHIKLNWKNYFLGHISIFLRTLKSNARKTAQKIEKRIL